MQELLIQPLVAQSVCAAWVEVSGLTDRVIRVDCQTRSTRGPDGVFPTSSRVHWTASSLFPESEVDWADRMEKAMAAQVPGRGLQDVLEPTAVGRWQPNVLSEPALDVLAGAAPQSGAALPPLVRLFVQSNFCQSVQDPHPEGVRIGAGLGYPLPGFVPLPGCPM